MTRVLAGGPPQDGVAAERTERSAAAPRPHRATLLAAPSLVVAADLLLPVDPTMRQVFIDVA